VSRTSDDTTRALADRLAVYESLVEVGVGNRTDLAARLAERGCTVTATDVHDRTVPERVQFIRDDVTDPDATVYADADAVYALNLPAELQRPTRACARTHDVPLLFTTLGTEQPVVPVSRETLPGETLFVVAAGRQ
jgi:uncharacterized UPF0146 family protein